MTRASTLAIAVLAVTLGCGGGGPTPVPPPPPTATAVPTTAPVEAGATATPERSPATPTPEPAWTAGIVHVEGGGRPALLREIRAAAHDGYDRIVFELEGELPGYHLEYVDRPVRECGSGRTVEVAGDGWLEVRLEPARAHEDGTMTVSSTRYDTGLPVVLEIVRTCDFEGVVTWVVGTASPNRYRVTTLEAPRRLVVDIRH